MHGAHRDHPGLASLIVVSLVATAAFGLLLRLDLANGAVTAAGLDFANVRHAHSHLGFYGFLTLAWWLVLRERGALVLPRGFVPGHLAVVFVATALFAHAGYDAATIALSTVVALSWLYIAIRSRHVKGWLSLAPWGVLAGTLLIPAIAVMARRDFALSRELAHVFVALMLMWVFVPMALAALRVPVVGRLFWLASTALGSSYLVFADRWPWPLGLFLSLAGALLLIALRPVLTTWPRYLAAAWGALALGLVVLGLTPPLQLEAMRLVALHFTVLGPIALTLLHHLAPERAKARWPVLAFGLIALGVMLAAMALGPLGLLRYDLAMDTAFGAGVGIVVALIGLTLPRRFRVTRPAPRLPGV